MRFLFQKIDRARPICCGLLESGKPPRNVARAFGVGRSMLYRVLKLMDDSVMVASGAE
jgi:hypothetical protein